MPASSVASRGIAACADAIMKSSIMLSTRSAPPRIVVSVCARALPDLPYSETQHKPAHAAPRTVILVLFTLHTWALACSCDSLLYVLIDTYSTCSFEAVAGKRVLKLRPKKLIDSPDNFA